MSQTHNVFVFTHDLLGDPFWEEFRRGLKDAEVQFSMHVLHHRVDRYAPGAMERLMTDALSTQNPDAILTTIPAPQEVEAPLRRAIDRGVPVFAVNARDPRPKASRIPYLLFIGAQDEAGGRLAATQLLDRCGCHCVLLVDHYRWKQTCHSDRVSGARSVLDSHGVRHETLEIDGTDRARSIDGVLSALERRPEIDGVLTLGPPGASAVLGAIDRAGRPILANHVTFDVSVEQTEAICDGRIVAAMDCQQYLQGLLGVGIASIYLRTGFFPTDDIFTGPLMIDRQMLIAKRSSGLRSGADIRSARSYR
jgi:simple sugar transport system substrate-binding protein